MRDFCEKTRKETGNMNKKIYKITGLILIAALIFTACSEETLLLNENGSLQTEENAGAEEGKALESGNGKLADTVPDSVGITLFVHVCGAVEEPGVYELPAGSRIYDAVMTAGGFDMEADREAVNLVEEIADGEQIRIPFMGEQNFNTGGGLIDINNANVDALCEIPGIGESRAQAILTYREENGGFQSKEDLMKVPGIKEGIYARISPYIECR